MRQVPQPTSIAALHPLDWVNEYTNAAIPLYGQIVEPILHFSILWNLFERDACGKDATRNRIGMAVSAQIAAREIGTAPFAEHLAYFQSRAQRGGMTIEQYLDALRMEERDRPLVSKVLSGETDDAKHVVHALLLVARRIRNNLFHGEKDVALLHTQADLFRAVNSLIATYLTVTRSAT